MSGFREYLEEARKEYHEQLMTNRNRNLTHGVRRYLAEHGIDSREIVVKYQLGCVAEPIPGDAERGFSDSLVFPYLGRKGTAAVKFRKFNSNLKYHGPDGQKHRLYNTLAYFEAEEFICLTEGEVDAICAHEILGFPAMGLPGAKSWAGNSKIWAPLFKDFRRVIILRDGDEAGINLAKSIVHSLTWRARVIACDDEMDVSSMVAAGRADELRSQIIAQVEGD